MTNEEIIEQQNAYYMAGYPSKRSEKKEEWYVILNMNCKYEICRRCPKSGLFKGSYEECEEWIEQKQKEKIKFWLLNIGEEIGDIAFDYITKLEKENSELKDYRLTTLAKQQTEMSKYALNLEHKLNWYDDQLTKAKKLLERLLITSCNSDVLSLLPNCSEVLKVRVEAEQFLNEVEK